MMPHLSLSFLFQSAATWTAARTGPASPVTAPAPPGGTGPGASGAHATTGAERTGCAGTEPAYAPTVSAEGEAGGWVDMTVWSGKWDCCTITRLPPPPNQAGTVSTAPWRVALATATGTGSARRTTRATGSAGATQDGSARDATSRWRGTARTRGTTTEVSGEPTTDNLCRMSRTVES